MPLLTSPDPTPDPTGNTFPIPNNMTNTMANAMPIANAISSSEAMPDHPAVDIELITHSHDSAPNPTDITDLITSLDASFSRTTAHTSDAVAAMAAQVSNLQDQLCEQQSSFVSQMARVVDVIENLTENNSNLQNALDHLTSAG